MHPYIRLFLIIRPTGIKESHKIKYLSGEGNAHGGLPLDNGFESCLIDWG
jgi:hypothetical protein